MQKILREVDWVALLCSDTDLAYIHFLTKITEIDNLVAPIREFKISLRKLFKNPWMNQALLKKIRVKDLLFKTI